MNNETFYLRFYSVCRFVPVDRFLFYYFLRRSILLGG